MESRLHEAIDELYAGGPEDFVARRAKIAAELAGQGLMAEAADVKKRRRPSIAAAAVNEVVRSHPDDLHALGAAGDRMHAAQEDALAGRGAADLRAAAKARNELVDRLTEATLAALATTSPQPETYRSAIADTFEAASIDPEARAQLESGALVKELSLRSGLGTQDPQLTAPVPAPAKARAKPKGDAEQARARDVRTDKARADAVADARRAQRDARQAADRDDAAAMRARALADEAARTVEDLDDRLASARRAEREARAASRRADQTARRSAAAFAKATERLHALQDG
jgi:hypothetical protein